MEEQRQWGAPSPYFFPAEESADLALQSAISRLTISSEFDGDRHRQMTPVIGSSRGVSDVAAGSRLDPPIAYQQLQGGGNVEGLLTMRRVAQNGYGDFLLGFGGAHQDSNVGQARNLTPVAADLGGSSNHGSAASPLPPPSPFNNGESFFHDHYPFLLCKKPLHRNPTPNFPIRSISPEVHHRKHQCSLLNLEDLRGKIISLGKDQTGCRILQHSLNFWTTEEIEVVLSEVIDSLVDLMNHQSGSYLIQKLFSLCSDEQKLRIILALTMNPYDLVYICLNSFGARAMHKMLEVLSSFEQRFMVMTALSLGAVTLACDTNGHLVVLYCLNNFPFEFNERFINGIVDKCFRVATNIRGCRVLQLCVENARGEVRERLVCEILANAVHLSGDPYGNYVVQHLLDQNIPGVEDTLLKCLEGKFATLSCNKYSSNVVEKFFVKSGENSNKIIMELITSPNASMLLVDPFANYVIQKALKVATGELFTALVNLILVNASSMQSNKHGRKILAWFDE
ncbi:PREDICTED: pumilio homolog 9-like isoform X2 [Ipomoea nil]|uniref:pumilio homolog 9-like isoform X2 n=1 Tax=Ipomoea nil TaxID=35883 RepID=UPI000901E24A|nr:PREDICTED: pumilio homolog 9-like isoform X2 [Ipomoea nil]